MEKMQNDKKDILPEKWSSYAWSFMVREEGCIHQDWHMDDEHGHFCIMPIYPCGDVENSKRNFKYLSMQGNMIITR